MGNKQSSSDRRTRDVSEGITREERPSVRKAQSDTDIPNLVSQQPAPGNNVQFSGNFSTRIRDARQIGGKPAGNELFQMFSPNPLIAEDTIYEDVADESARVPNRSSGEDLDLYDRALKKVTSIWPEYGNIRRIDVRSLKYPVRNSLHHILKRLCEQHDLIRRLQAEKHDISQELAEIKEENEAKGQLIARRDREIRTLKETIFILRTELKKRANEDNLPIPDNKRSFSSSYDQEERFHRRKKEGIYQATPLLLADGGKKELNKALKRTGSLKPIQNDYDQREGRLSNGTTTSDADVKEKLWQLEMALEKERKQNEILRDKLSAVGSEPSSPRTISSLRIKANPSPEEYAERYSLLEVALLGKVANALSRQLSHTSHRRQRQFACAVVQKSYDVALIQVNKFKDLIKALIKNPANPDIHQASMNSNQKMALAGQISLFEHFKPGYEINNTSKVSGKTKIDEELPETLTNEIYEFLEGMADYTNIADLIEGVVDSLRQEYGDCTTASLLNKAEFSDFLYDCCRFAWQACVIRQPLHVSSTEYWRYDDRYHVTDGDRSTTNARIDFYIFPILFTKKNNGEVLYKGRVTLYT